MDLIYTAIIACLFILAAFDLSVGVSNDASNFLNSAVGCKAASFKRIIFIAGIGVFIGAAMSNGMMDIARHGVFHPQYFSFYEVMCIFTAVIVTDVILLDLFNSRGLPTSTTVSLVFELLGAAFIIALFKTFSGEVSSISNLLNTQKAVTLISAIFLSVLIAFAFGSIVQFLTRLIFSFNYHKYLGKTIAVFGAVSMTAIVYFLLIKGIKDLSFATPELRRFIASHSGLIICASLAFFAILSQVLYLLKVNVLKFIVLSGTFALAMAFAGNDLVNFIGVPLAAFSSFQAFQPSLDTSIAMSSLNDPAQTPVFFLLISGGVMVFALATSRKAKKVVQTSIDLSKHAASTPSHSSDSSTHSHAIPLARFILSASSRIGAILRPIIPPTLRRFVNRRFASPTLSHQTSDAPAFDLLRGAVNLVVAAALIALGTSLKLPLSTTYVTFMVAMGTSLADRAWGHGSALFRIAGVISVISGWFITAALAFLGAAAVAAILFFAGEPAMIAASIVAVAFLIHSNIRFNRNKTSSGRIEGAPGCNKVSGSFRTAV